MNLVLGSFLVAFVGWVVIRVTTWPLPEWGRRTFWVVVILLGTLIMFLGNRIQTPVERVGLFMSGGAATAEAIVTNLRQRWDRSQAKHVAAQQASQEREKKERRERRRRRRHQDDDAE